MWGSGFFSVRRRRPRLMITFKAEQKKTFSPSVLALCTSSDTSLSFISTQCLLSQTWELIKNEAATGKHFTAAMFRGDPDWVGCLTGVDGRSSSDLFAAQWARKELLKFTWNKKHMDFPSLLLTKNKTGKITTDVFSQSSLTALRKSRYLWSAHIVSRRLQNPLTPVMLTFLPVLWNILGGIGAHIHGSLGKTSENHECRPIASLYRFTDFSTFAIFWSNCKVGQNLALWTTADCV